MSDSEEEFASADEGDVEDKTTKNVKKKEESGQKEAAGKHEAKETKPEQQKGKNTKKGKGAKDGNKKPEVPTQKESSTPAAASGNATAKPQDAKGKKGKQKGGKGKQQKSADKTSEEDMKTDKTGTSETKDATQSIESSDKSENKEVENTQTEVKDSPASESVQPQESTPVKYTGKDTDTSEGVNESDSKETDKKSDARLNVDEPSLIKSPSSQSITRPPPDHTEKEEAVLDRLSNVGSEKKSGGWGWGWGSSLLEAASTSVTTFTNEVGEGLHTMMETVESTLNVPNPEELAKNDNQETDSDDEESESKEETGETSEPEKAKTKTKAKVEKTSTEQKKDEPSQSKEQTEEKPSSHQTQESPSEASSSWFSSWGVGNISKMVETTSKSLVHGGLDALETLGKKTFDVINEHDPGLKKTRGFLVDRGDKPNLSAVLRDAKEQEEVRALQEKESEEARKAHFGSLFDDFQGLAHLEALEMLSNQSEKRVNTLLAALPPDAVSAIKPVLLKVKENFELDEDEEEETEEQEFERLVTDLVKEINVGLTADKLVKTCEKIYGELKECCGAEGTKPDPKELHRIAISGLAELTSKCIEQFHKSGELILLQKAELSDFVTTSQTLLRLTKVLSTEVGILSGKFTTELNKLESGDEIKVNHLVTNVYLEATNSSSYIQDGFQLLLPVLQQATIEKSQEPVS